MYTHIVFLSKQVLTIAAARLYTSKVLQMGERDLCAWVVFFLGKYASVTAVDLIQQKKLDFINLT